MIQSEEILSVTGGCADLLRLARPQRSIRIRMDHESRPFVPATNRPPAATNR
jgi:hypothetical protein